MGVEKEVCMACTLQDGTIPVKVVCEGLNEDGVHCDYRGGLCPYVGSYFCEECASFYGTEIDYDTCEKLLHDWIETMWDEEDFEEEEEWWEQEFGEDWIIEDEYEVCEDEY